MLLFPSNTDPASAAPATAQQLLQLQEPKRREPGSGTQASHRRYAPGGAGDQPDQTPVAQPSGRASSTRQIEYIWADDEIPQQSNDELANDDREAPRWTSQPAELRTMFTASRLANLMMISA